MIWLGFSCTFPPQIKACAADKVEKEMEEMMESPEFQVYKYLHP